MVLEEPVEIGMQRQLELVVVSYGYQLQEQLLCRVAVCLQRVNQVIRLLISKLDQEVEVVDQSKSSLST